MYLLLIVYFVLPLKNQFLTRGILFLAMAMSSRVLFTRSYIRPSLFQQIFIKVQ